jgi:endonuclease/exonuclease/phosphatase family metal-dependent hydrolase
LGGDEVIASAPPAELHLPAQLHLVVGSYNIHGGIGSDGVRDLARIGRVVNALGADIVAVQEVGGFPLEDDAPAAVNPAQDAADAAAALAAHTGMLAIRGFTMRRRGADYGNLVLTRFPPLSVRKLDLSVGRQEPRGALDVTFDISGARVRLIATHLGLIPGERRAQVKRIVELVRTGGAGDETATLLLGDINEWWAFGRPLRWLHRCFEGRAHGDRTFPARWPMFALDRIWVHPKRALARYQVYRGPETRVASDHLPVRAELVLPLQAARTATVSATVSSGGDGLQQGDGQLREQLGGG